VFDKVALSIKGSYVLGRIIMTINLTSKQLDKRKQL